VPETDDLRGAMSLRVIEALKARAPEAVLHAYDPVVGREAAEALGLGLVMFDDPLDALDGADAAIIANNHPGFASLSVAGMAARLKPGGFVYDFWNHLGDSHADLQGTHYFSVGSIRRQPRP
jgi:UDP-N-acetyl-D-mannosaminuronic acid dehydrogenase